MAAAAPPSGSSPTQPAASPAPTRSGRPPRRRRVKWIIAAVVLLALAVGGFEYWRKASLFASTDDAYVQAHQVEIAAVKAAAAAVQAAKLDLERTHVASPTTGTIANLSLRPGNTVQVGVPLFVLISDTEYWIDANFKETELADIRPGQKAEIHSDMY